VFIFFLTSDLGEPHIPIINRYGVVVLKCLLANFSREFALASCYKLQKLILFEMSHWFILLFRLKYFEVLTMVYCVYEEKAAQ